jgi:hypothetical protein
MKGKSMKGKSMKGKSMKGKGAFQTYLVPTAPARPVVGMKKMNAMQAAATTTTLTSTSAKTLFFGLLGGLADSAHKKMGKRDLKGGMMMMGGSGNDDGGDNSSGAECSESAEARPKCGTYFRGRGKVHRGMKNMMMGNNNINQRQLKGSREDDDSFDDDWECRGQPRGPRRDMKQRMPRPASRPTTSAPASS